MWIAQFLVCRKRRAEIGKMNEKLEDGIAASPVYSGGFTFPLLFCCVQRDH